MIEIEKLSFKYSNDSSFILENINYKFDTGKLYCITGKSGTGKTTLISLLAGLEKPVSGKVIYNGTDISGINLNTYRSKHVGVIFQSYNLLIKHSALFNIKIGLYLAGKNHDNINAYKSLNQIGIDRVTAGRKTLYLSGGEQQRVAICRTLAMDPDIIIADEPTGNLDDENMTIIMDLLKNQTKNGKCVIIATHSNDVLNYADIHIKIEKGNISNS